MLYQIFETVAKPKNCKGIYHVSKGLEHIAAFNMM